MKDINSLKYESLMAGDIRYDTSSEAPIYIGLHQDTDADDDAPNWIIFKNTYSGDYKTRTQRAEGSWTGRVALF